MIQLASEATASRTSARPGQSDGKGSTLDVRRGRTGHAWPFLSRAATRSSQQQAQKPTANDSGS
jgi:hypothetical protein